jgi:hypothetical protein
MTDERAAIAPQQWPTVSEAERFILKLEKCEGMAAKLILLQNFIQKADHYSRAQPSPKWIETELWNFAHGLALDLDLPDADAKIHKAMAAAIQAHSRAQAASGFDEATETRWQNAIYEVCKKAVGPENDSLIDGGGTDSGDALDFTLTEISQAIHFWRDVAESRAPSHWPTCDYTGHPCLDADQLCRCNTCQAWGKKIRESSREAAAPSAPERCLDCGQPESAHSAQNQWCPPEFQSKKYKNRPTSWHSAARKESK